MPFGSLWLPGIVSAVAVFLVSGIFHMALKYHRADYKKLPDEDPVTEAIRKVGPAPGHYFMPYYLGNPTKDPAMRKKLEEGPVGFLTILRSGVPNPGKNLSQWFLFCLLASFLTAYVLRHTLDFGADGFTVLRIASAVAFMGYGLGPIQNSIWGGIPWSNALRAVFDALVYALLTGLAFRLLWPAA
jgi:hypothetical protein